MSTIDIVSDIDAVTKLNISEYTIGRRLADQSIDRRLFTSSSIVDFTIEVILEDTIEANADSDDFLGKH